MEIGSITSMNGMSGMQTTITNSPDSKNKNLQNKIAATQRQMRALSSKEELSVHEKTAERKKLQNKISGLNTELKQHQEEFRKSQKREIMMAELLEDDTPAKDKTAESKTRTEPTSLDMDTAKKMPVDKPPTDAAKEAADEKGAETSGSTIGADTKSSREEKTAPASADNSTQQTGRQETVITKNDDGVVILKKTNRTEKHNADALKKQAENTPVDNTDEKTPSADKTHTEKDKEFLSEKDAKNVDNTADIGLSRKEMLALVSADASAQQAYRQGTVMARLQDGIVILKGEINQDERLGIDTEKKRTELEKMEQREQRVMAFQSSIFGETKNAANPTSGTMVSGTMVSGTKNRAQVNAKNNAFQLSQLEAQASQQRFYVSLDN